MRGANPPLEEKRARDDADRAEGHHGSRHHRVKMEAEGKEDAHGKRDPEHVVHARPYEVASDRPEDRMRKVERRDDVKQVRAHEHDIGCLDRNRRSRGKRNANGCCDKRG